MTAFFNSVLLAPAMLAFLGLIPVVVVLYLLKMRRTPVVVSSTLLWHKSLQDLTANAPFQRLRRNLLLLLQILVLIALAVGLARPYVKAVRAGGHNLCLLIDRSASMGTIEKGSTRLDLAREKALEMINGMGGGDKMMVVAFASKSDVLCELTDDRYRLRDAVNKIAPADTNTRVRDAVLVANSLAKGALPQANVAADVVSGVSNLRTVILSDGRIEDLDMIGSRAFDVSYMRIGETADNAGVVAFSVREPMEGRETGERQCLVLVRNESDAALKTTLTLSLDEQDLAVEDVDVPARDSREVLFALPGGDTTGLLRATLDHEDALAVDNAAWLALRPPVKVRVLLVAEPDSTGAYFLKRVLSLNPRVELSAVAPANYAAPDNADLIIFDGFAPAQLPPAASVYFNAAPAMEGLAIGGEIASPPIVSTDPEHPVMRFVNPSNVTIAKCRALTLPEGGRALISTRGTALMADVSRDNRPILVTGFGIADSNWPLRLSFPLLMQNLVAWAPLKTTEKDMSLATGAPLALTAWAGADTAEIALPGGAKETVKLDPTRPVHFANTVRAGIYRVRQGDKSELYAVNLLSPAESAIKPADSITIGRSEVAAQTGPIRENREYWRWLVLAAIGILALEWWIYSRRAWI